MQIPLHVLLRKKIRASLYSFLSLFTSTNNTQHSVKKEEIKTIMIIRPNYRIGNLIFLTPLINELQKEIPEATIDIIVGMKLAGNILQPLPNVKNVYAIPRKLLTQPLEMYKFITNIRKKRYDIAINITAGSVSSEIVTSLVNAKYKASFENEKSFISLTHTIKEEHLYKHTSLIPLELLKLFTPTLPTKDLKLDIKVTQEELDIAKLALNELMKKNSISQTAPKITLFRNARFDKKIADSWWNEWHKELLTLDSSIVIIDILSPDIPTKLNETVVQYADKNLRVLGAFFSLCDLYISADTGPLHLASASGAKCLALFNKTSIEKFGTLEKESLTLDINNLSPKDVAIQTYNKIQEKR